MSLNVPDSTRGTCATWATRLGRSVASGSVTTSSFQRISPVLLTRPASAPSRLDLPEPTCPRRRTSSPALTSRSTSWTPSVPSSCTALRSRRLRVRSGSRWARTGSSAVPADRSIPAGRTIRSPPPARALVASIQARVPGASVTTAPATRPNQSNPLTALATSSAVASSQWPVSRPVQAATTPHWTITTGTPSSSDCTRCSRTAASTRPASTSRRCRWRCGVAAASLTVRIDSSVETSAWPKPARAADAAAADRPATRRPSEEASADAVITASRIAAGEPAPRR